MVRPGLSRSNAASVGRLAAHGPHQLAMNDTTTPWGAASGTVRSARRQRPASSRRARSSAGARWPVTTPVGVGGGSGAAGALAVRRPRRTRGGGGATPGSGREASTVRLGRQQRRLAPQGKYPARPYGSLLDVFRGGPAGPGANPWWRAPYGLHPQAIAPMGDVNGDRLDDLLVTDDTPPGGAHSASSVSSCCTAARSGWWRRCCRRSPHRARGFGGGPQGHVLQLQLDLEDHLGLNAPAHLANVGQKHGAIRTRKPCPCAGAGRDDEDRRTMTDTPPRCSAQRARTALTAVPL
jgi:hypothetical protein